MSLYKKLLSLPKINILEIALLHGLLFFLFVPIQLRYDNVQFFIFSIALATLYAINITRQDQLNFNLIGFSFFLFIIYCIFSSFFAINTSLTWYPFSIKVVFVSYFLLLVNYLQRYELYHLNFHIIMAAIAFIISGCCTVIFGEQPHICKTCFLHIGNYVCSYGILLTPYLLSIDKSKFKKINLLKIVFILMLLLLSLASGARGVVVSSIFLLLAFLLLERKFKVLIVSTIVLVLSLISISQFADLNILSEFGKRFELSRFYNQIIAWDLFRLNITTGVGLGNWTLAFNSISLDEYDDFFLYYNHLMSLDNHNQISDLFVEVGIGSLLYFVPIISVIVVSMLSYKKLPPLVKASLYSAAGFLILGIFYRSVNSDVYFFSRSQFLFALALGMLSYNLSNYRINKVSSIALGMGLIISSTWFLYFNLKDRVVIKAQRSNYAATTKIELISSEYNKLLYTHNSAKIPLKSTLAKMSFEMDDTLSSSTYYTEALHDSPYNPEILRMLSIISLRLGKVGLAEDYATNLLNKERDYIEPLLVILEIKCLWNIDVENAMHIIKLIEQGDFIKPYIPYINFWKSEILIRKQKLTLNKDQVQIRNNLFNLLKANEFNRQRSYPDFVNILKLSKAHLRTIENL